MGNTVSAAHNTALTLTNISSNPASIFEKDVTEYPMHKDNFHPFMKGEMSIKECPMHHSNQDILQVSLINLSLKLCIWLNWSLYSTLMSMLSSPTSLHTDNILYNC